jgi:hypothetical protein
MTVRKKIIRRRVSAPGCDDAPIVTVQRHVSPRLLTFIYPYYENPKMLAYQVGNWNSYPVSLRDNLRVVIVDDGSPDSPAATVLRQIRPAVPVDLYRIDVDVRWNWLAARNLGVDRTSDGWLLLTDMDHVVPAETLETAIYGMLDPGIVYRFSRREHDGTPVGPHPNSWLMTRAMFWKIGGYDETLSGHYGTDGEYRRRAAKTAPIRILRDKLVRHEFMFDASTTRYKRKQPEDVAAVPRLVMARTPDWKPKLLSFPWRHVPL